MTYSRRFATWKYKGAAQEVVYFQEALLRTVLYDPYSEAIP